MSGSSAEELGLTPKDLGIEPKAEVKQSTTRDRASVKEAEVQSPRSTIGQANNSNTSNKPDTTTTNPESHKNQPTAQPEAQVNEVAMAQSLDYVRKLAESVFAGRTQALALDNYVEYIQRKGVPFDNIAQAVRTVELPIRQSRRLRPRKNQNGSISLTDKEGKVVAGYEKGFLDVKLPSGLSTHIMADSRISGYQAEYNPQVGAIVFTGQTLAEIASPAMHAANEEAKKDGWRNLEQRTKYFVKHEFTHFVWDQLDSLTQKRILEIFSKSENIATTRAFGAILISHPGYKGREETSPIKDSYEFQYAGGVHRYSKELVINELLAHAVLGEMMPREEMTRIQRSVDRAENFGARSKAAYDCLDKMKQQNPDDYNLLVQSGLVQNKNFDRDYQAIVNTVKSLHTNSPLGFVQVT